MYLVKLILSFYSFHFKNPLSCDLLTVLAADLSPLPVNHVATGPFLCKASAVSLFCQVPEDQIPDLQAPGNTE